MPQFLRFCVVGGIGFGIDAGVLVLLLAAGVGPYLGRVASYLVAATATWYLNRRFTFAYGAAARRLHREWASYVAVNGIGGLINYGVYALCLLTVAAMRDRPVLAVAAGSAVALVFNFTANRLLVFRR